MNKRIRSQVINAHDYTILAVDDAQDTLVLLDFDLSGEGFTVLTAKSGKIALSMMQTHPVDLVLLDIYMPGISGLSTLKEIKSKPEFSHIPVIMLSASGDEDQIVTALECGAADYATKPYNAKILLARIRTSLRLMKKNIELESIARTDYLTKLDNRGSF
jgi:DNA-binding response OmpR family regulator